MQRRFTGAWTIQRPRHFERHKRCSTHHYRHSRYILHPRAVLSVLPVQPRVRAPAACIHSHCAQRGGNRCRPAGHDARSERHAAVYTQHVLSAVQPDRTCRCDRSLCLAVLAVHRTGRCLYRALATTFRPMRIRWCFYLSLINILLRMLPTSIPTFSLADYQPLCCLPCLSALHIKRKS